MKLLCLGTGAADWPIDRYDEFPFFRRFTSTLINDDLLIDPGPHVYHYIEKNNCPTLLAGIKNILVTHSHGDHFTPATVRKIADANDGVALWGSFACRDKLIAALGDLGNIEFHELKKGDRLSVGGYDVLAVPSNHSTDIADEITFHYAITDGEGKQLFYALDGGWLTREEWNMIRAAKYSFHAIVMDCTMGDTVMEIRIFEHNTIPMIEIMADTIRAMKVLRPEVGQIYANHMARTLHKDHKSLTARLAPLDIIPCRDGMEITV
ncbi:MAG: MBL fold metallo-hydrolase [Clostridia bacterium]|nr:MBL fold metallo-hydrolase [Clostridia bacterium]